MRVAVAVLFAALFAFAFVLESATLVALIAPGRLDDRLARSPGIPAPPPPALACSVKTGGKC